MVQVLAEDFNLKHQVGPEALCFKFKESRDAISRYYMRSSTNLTALVAFSSKLSLFWLTPQRHATAFVSLLEERLSLQSHGTMNCAFADSIDPRPAQRQLLSVVQPKWIRCWICLRCDGPSLQFLFAKSQAILPACQRAFPS